MTLYEDECRAAGKDPREIEELAREFSKLGRRARKMGITVFGGSGTGTLRYAQRSENGVRDYEDHRGSLILADIDGHFDGGDGSCDYRFDGLLRGE